MRGAWFAAGAATVVIARGLWRRRPVASGHVDVVICGDPVVVEHVQRLLEADKRGD